MSDSTLLGSAQFSEFEGYSKDKLVNGANIVIGKSTKEGCEHLWHGRKIEKHFVSVAPTRSGKGAALIIPNLLVYQGSSIVIDPKGENAYITAPKRRKMGQKVHILDPWGEVNRRYGEKAGEKEETASFNPLSVLDPKSEHYADDLAYIADALIINQGKDPHWDDSARELVAGLIAFAVEKYGQKASLPLVRLLLTKSPEEIAGMAQEAQEWGFYNIAARKLGRFTGESKELNAIISTALTQTAFLDSETLGKNMEESSFSFHDLTEGTATIYLVLPVDKLQTYGRWLRLMVSIGIRTIARNTAKLPLPVLFFLDEFGTIGKLSAVSQAVGLMAGLQMCIWIFVQDLIQLKRDYPNEWETFIANAGAVTAFNVMDQFTADYISKMLGQTTVERISVATAEKRRGGFFGGDPNYSAMADQQFSRALLNPDEVRRLLPNRGLFLVAGLAPNFFNKALYYNEPLFYQHARHDPYYPDPQEGLKKIHIKYQEHYESFKKKLDEFFEEKYPDYVKEGLKKSLKYMEDWDYEKAEIELSILEGRFATHKKAVAAKELAVKGFAAIKGRFFK